MKAYLFPGQGSQFEGMGREEYEQHVAARELFDEADAILGFSLSDVMFTGTSEDLRQTRITQPAIYVHSYMRSLLAGAELAPDAAAGHSLGEFTALAASGAITFADGLRLVSERAEAMQEACEAVPGAMSAIVGLEDAVIEKICSEVDGVVVPANYNAPGQLVISGEISAVGKANSQLLKAGAKRALMLEVGGAFHSPLMLPAQERLQKAIQNIAIHTPKYHIYQNVTATATSNPDTIKERLIQQLTTPVRWTQTMWQMLEDGAGSFVEVGGRGRILAGLLRRIDRSLDVQVI